jgi:hypothetical protein
MTSSVKNFYRLNVFYKIIHIALGSDWYQVYGILGFNAMIIRDSTFRRNLSPPFTGLKTKKGRNKLILAQLAARFC